MVQWRSWVCSSLALTLCLAFGTAAQARGGGGGHSHGSVNGPQATSVGAKNSAATHSYRTHIHPNMIRRSAKKTKKPTIRDISIPRRLIELRPDLVKARAECEMNAGATGHASKLAADQRGARHAGGPAES
jgi:hypothetical protein